MLKRLSNPVSLIQTHPYLSLWGAALILRLVAALVVRQPGFVDAYYYYGVAANWHDGRGLSENLVWNYQVGAPPADATGLDHPAFGYWTPLATLLTAASFALFGVSFWAASLPFMLCAAALPPLAYRLGGLMFGPEQRRYSWTMGLITLFPGRFFLFWNTPDNFSPFALTILAGLIALYLGLYRDQRWLLTAGLLAGLAYLSRSDGSLFGVALVISFLWRRSEKTPKKPSWLYGAGAVGLAGLVVVPWLIRNELTFGTLVPVGNTKVLWLRTYQDFFSYGLKVDARYYFDWGWGNILASKVQTLAVDGLLIVFQGLFLLGPLFLVGLWAVRRQASWRPFGVYTTVLYLILALGFSEIGSHGTIFHSTGALVPFQAGLALAGLEWLGRGRARPKAASIMVLVAAGVTLYFAFAVAGPTWDSDYGAARRLESWLVQHNTDPKDVIMVGEPLSFHYATGRPAISQASDGLAANLAAARRYGAKWFVLGSERYGGLDELYRSGTASGAGLELRLVARLDDGNQIYRVVNTSLSE